MDDTSFVPSFADEFNFANIDASSKECSFEEGENYNGLVLGYWRCTNEYKGKVSGGMAFALLVEDDNGSRYIRRSPFINMSGNIFDGRSKFAQILQSYLDTKLQYNELKNLAISSGYTSPAAFVGKPCAVRFKACATQSGGTWWEVESFGRPTNRVKGITEIPAVADLEPVDAQKLFGKFIQLIHVDDCITIPTLRVIGRKKNPTVDGVALEQSQQIPQPTQPSPVPTPEENAVNYAEMQKVFDV